MYTSKIAGMGLWGPIGDQAAYWEKEKYVKKICWLSNPPLPTTGFSTHIISTAALTPVVGDRIKR